MKKVTKKVGRPPRADGPSNCKISVWFAPSEYAQLEAAKPEGYPMAAWARKLILEQVEQLTLGIPSRRRMRK